MKRPFYLLFAALALLVLLAPAKAQACVWTGTYFKCRDDIAKLAGQVFGGLQKAKKDFGGQVANLLRGNPSLTLEPYKDHLNSQAKGKMKALPGALTGVLRPHYPDVDFSKVRYAEGIDTIHGRAITIGERIYLPRKINLNNSKDLHWMLHELEHVAQYARHGDESDFIAQYVEEALNVSAEKLSNDKVNSAEIHDEIKVERLAREKADAIIKDVWRALG
ncbi:MAG TPA: DUF4157 domain-containing protein, partial [Rhodospirillales bacterium]|nr:DUF4157 domain-containing protein [Rhodospirillales bacterium]